MRWYKHTPIPPTPNRIRLEIALIVVGLVYVMVQGILWIVEKVAQ